MRLALISDVHANVVALEAVLDDIEVRDADMILSAGDVVGYYPYPNETVELFRARGIISIRGNHDRAVLRADPRGMNPVAGDAIMWTAFHLTASSLRYLRSLPPRAQLHADRIAVGLYHGSPRDDDEYVYEGQACKELLAMSHSELMVLGHTHIPYVKKHPGGVIVNPGSVGQPRDGVPEASYSVFDIDTNEATNHRVAYDIGKVAEATRDAGLPDRLADRLFSGL